jgi:hypothetical protein
VVGQRIYGGKSHQLSSSSQVNRPIAAADSAGPQWCWFTHDGPRCPRVAQLVRGERKGCGSPLGAQSGVTWPRGCSREVALDYLCSTAVRELPLLAS